MLYACGLRRAEQAEVESQNGTMQQAGAANRGCLEERRCLEAYSAKEMAGMNGTDRARGAKRLTIVR